MRHHLSWAGILTTLTRQTMARQAARFLGGNKSEMIWERAGMHTHGLVHCAGIYYA